VKNKKMFKLKKAFIHQLEQHLQKGNYESYFKKNKPTDNEFLVLGPKCNGLYKKPNVLPNTVMLAFVKNKEFSNKTFKSFCNVNIKKKLNAKNIIVSVGSACSTNSAKASHVLYSIKAPDIIKQGVMRVSLSDDTTLQEITQFVKILVACVRSQMPI
jgi:cysteine sulfinate desulfinase/cysteine desulfurase-like protein